MGEGCPRIYKGYLCHILKRCGTLTPSTLSFSLCYCRRSQTTALSLSLTQLPSSASSLQPVKAATPCIVSFLCIFSNVCILCCEVVLVHSKCDWNLFLCALFDWKVSTYSWFAENFYTDSVVWLKLWTFSTDAKKHSLQLLVLACVLMHDYCLSRWFWKRRLYFFICI